MCWSGGAPRWRCHSIECASTSTARCAARTRNSRFETCLPVFKRYGVGAINYIANIYQAGNTDKVIINQNGNNNGNQVGFTHTIGQKVTADHNSVELSETGNNNDFSISQEGALATR